MNNETWTDWLIQCDFMQDITSFDAIGYVHAYFMFIEFHRLAYTGSRMSGRITSDLHPYKVSCASARNLKTVVYSRSSARRHKQTHISTNMTRIEYSVSFSINTSRREAL